MDRVMLLYALRDFTREATKDLILPTRVQSQTETPQPRAPDVYLMRLPDSKQATKKAPYILHQVLTGYDKQPERTKTISTCQVRSIFCAYSEDEQEGGIMLLTMAERVRIPLLKSICIGGQFDLDRAAGIEFLAYPDDTAPYYAGEMITTWNMPPVEREVRKLWE